MEEAGRELSSMLNITELGEEISSVTDMDGEDLEDVVDPDLEAEALKSLMELKISKGGALLPTIDITVSGPPQAALPSALEALRAQLDRLVAEEAYEEAARVRDQISDLEESGEPD
jgi:excinuclease UvrABC helicase subunit UvrB